MMMNSKAKITQEQTATILGKPSRNLTFISYRVWDLLLSEDKVSA